MDDLKPGQVKYHRDAPFADPVVRCDSCQRLFLKASIPKMMGCPSCGHRQVKNVMLIESDPERSASRVDEVAQIQTWIREGKVDPDWMHIWEERSDE